MSNPNWQLEPTQSQIAERAQQLQISPAEAAEELRALLQADARRLDLAMSGSLDAVREAQAAADRANEEADRALRDRLAIIESFEINLVALGEIHLKIDALKRLVLPAADEQSVAHAALDCFLLAQSDTASPELITGWRSSLADYTWRMALSPHIGTFLKPLEARAEALAAELKAEAQAKGINIRAVVKMIEDVTAGRAPGDVRHPGFLRFVRAGAFNGL